jgi:hypothetical protein
MAKTLALMAAAMAVGAGLTHARQKGWLAGWPFGPARTNPALTSPDELRHDVAALGQEEKVLVEKRRHLAEEQAEDQKQLAAVAAVVTPPGGEEKSARLVAKALEVAVLKRDLQLERLDAELRRVAAAKRARLEQLVAAGDGVTRADLRQLADEVMAQASGSPRAEMAEQFALLMGGKAADLKAHFTDRVRERVTPQAVAFGRKLYRDEPFAELAARFETDESAGVCVVRTATGRELTRLVRDGGKWKADAVWFD